MNILIQADKNYIDLACVMLCSLFESNKNININVYLLHNNLDESNINLQKNNVIHTAAKIINAH